MSLIYIEVITSPNCPHSPRALKMAKDIASKASTPLILKEVSIATDEGMTRAEELEVTATPTIVINGRVAFVGAPTKNDLVAAVKKTEEKENDINSSYF